MGGGQDVFLPSSPHPTVTFSGSQIIYSYIYLLNETALRVHVSHETSVMNTLTSIEADRVDQILWQAFRRLELLSVIPTVDDDAFISKLKSVPVSASLDRLWMAEHQLSEMYDASLIGRDMFAVRQAHRAVRACCRYAP